MAPNELRRINRSVPFTPYRLFLTDGSTYDVRHPDLVVVGLRSAFLGLPATANPELFDNWVHIDLLHIVKVEPITPPAAATPAAS